MIPSARGMRDHNTPQSSRCLLKKCGSLPARSNADNGATRQGRPSHKMLVLREGVPLPGRPRHPPGTGPRRRSLRRKACVSTCTASIGSQCTRGTETVIPNTRSDDTNKDNSAQGEERKQDSPPEETAELSTKVSDHRRTVVQAPALVPKKLLQTGNLNEHIQLLGQTVRFSFPFKKRLHARLRTVSDRSGRLNGTQPRPL
ncbi:hypothetical protein TNIN_353881 [Trichonephila inaurata madagascariensis]|uniref:Uncharacterized protein n=1 Tax=Trichonephila inaurata madagascariensis TaxID=2747483 RepID=A0A8X7C7N4_9ARAC|nr:hypothetical protein TNIN_353881 [Trichonephila inaurata madagascariensis]